MFKILILNNRITLFSPFIKFNLDLTLEANTFPESYNDKIKTLYKKKFDALTLTHKILIKELVDHRLTKNNMESLRLIDDVVKLEQNPSEIMEEDKGSGSSLNSQSKNTRDYVIKIY